MGHMRGADGQPGEAGDGQALAREIGAAPELERMVEELHELGVPPDAIRRAHGRDRIEEAIFEAVLDPARSERTVTAAEIEAEGGLRVDETRLIALNFGLRVPEPDEPYFTPAEAAVLRRFGDLREIWQPEVYLQIVRRTITSSQRWVTVSPSLVSRGRIPVGGATGELGAKPLDELASGRLGRARPIEPGVGRERLGADLG